MRYSLPPEGRRNGSRKPSFASRWSSVGPAVWLSCADCSSVSLSCIAWMASGVILEHIPQKATHCAHHSAWIDSQTAAAPSPPYATPTN